MLSSTSRLSFRNISKQCITGTKWSPEKELHQLPDPATIIKEHEIYKAIVESNDKASDVGYIRSILQKAKDCATMKDVPGSNKEFMLGLDIPEAAALLNIHPSNTKLLDELYQTAFDIKNYIYGNRIVLFAPLYVANYCNCSCTYCGYRGTNTAIERCKLTLDQVADEIKVLEDMGHKRVLMLTGESPEYSFDEFLEAVKVASKVRSGKSGEIRRINVEIPTLSVSDMRRLKALGCVGTYTVFQETYHRESFKKYHPYGPKADYDYRITCMDRAQLGGIDDVGIGALFGLYDHRFEVLAMLQHAQHLDKTYGTGPHTISFPRIRPATGTPLSENPPHTVGDEDFKKLVAVVRCAVPYTGMIISTREDKQMRDQLLRLGISQLSAASSTEVGSYKADGSQTDGKKGQFSLYDHRPLDDVVRDLMNDGYVPSWCTACYRLGRTGEAFMKWAKSGEIHAMCHPNALQTLAEYLIDYASPETRKVGWDLISKEMNKITDNARRKQTQTRIDRIKKGERDLYF
ncbi:Fe-hydrogenase assembly protein [Tritrichomonas foetus]|uniref:Fe-hydrogenase assembly protein n=1 Tax=Tritrichomonas foetus TaxID=1144522 RepID=A0A1J4JWC7_9EUKA|nr:Fe-hydrogenase assembly protein [Tritrichomonas foetus]|eukprot:OHT02744.1 Fe-hydrogenase assembly protein [Tritrichomonas foetus]